MKTKREMYPSPSLSSGNYNKRAMCNTERKKTGREEREEGGGRRETKRNPKKKKTIFAMFCVFKNQVGWWKVVNQKKKIYKGDAAWVVVSTLVFRLFLFFFLASVFFFLGFLTRLLNFVTSLDQIF